MPFGQELQKIMSKRHPDAICLGSICYIRLGVETLAKAALTSGGGNYDGIQVTVLNRRTGPVDSITIRSWDVPHGVKKPPDFGEKAD